MQISFQMQVSVVFIWLVFFQGTYKANITNMLGYNKYVMF